MAKLTVKKLKEALKNVPDDLEVELWSDSGVDQCDDDDFETVVDDAFARKDAFIISANYVEREEE